MGFLLWWQSYLFIWGQVETGKKTLILHGTKTSQVLNEVMTEIYHLKRDNSVKYTRKNENVRPFESGGEASLEFFSLKTDCSLFVVSVYMPFSFLRHFLVQWVDKCWYIYRSMLIWICFCGSLIIMLFAKACSWRYKN